MAKWEVSKMWHDHRAALRKHTDEKGRHTPAKSKVARKLAVAERGNENRSQKRNLRYRNRLGGRNLLP